MSVQSKDGAGGLRDRVQDEMLETFDEELEMEIDDDRLTRALDQIVENPEQDTVDRSFYFKELLRLQRELVKLQDWVVATTSRRSSSCSKVAMPPARAVRSSASPSA